MLTKLNNSSDMNAIASDTIHLYINDGYRIDAKESVIDPNKDKDCTFKAVLKKDVDGITCKAVITLSESGDDKNKSCVYHKIEMVGDTKWSEETRSFSSSVDKKKLNNAVKDHVSNNCFKRLSDIIKTQYDHNEDRDTSADKVHEHKSAYNRLYDYVSSDDYHEDTVEDSLEKLVKYIFGK